MNHFSRMWLGLAVVAVVVLSGCSSSTGGSGGGAGGGVGGGAGGGSGGGAGGGSAGACSSFATQGEQLLNAPVDGGVTVVKKTPTNPPFDGGLP